jgi:Ca-activated chloride channel family protein
MTARVALLFVSVAAFAQLPTPQAPPPPVARDSRSSEPPSAKPRVDATVSDLQGHPIPGLTAADFIIEADGRQQPIESCVYHTGQPLRLAVILDDLSLSAARLDKARRALREFGVARLRPGDEATILRTSSGAGVLDRFTPDRDAFAAAIDRITYNPIAEDAPPDAFTAGTIGAVRGVLEGMRELPGRKALLLISDRLRTPARQNEAVAARITTLAHRASAVLFAIDMGAAPEQPFLLEQGLAGAARDTGGAFADGGDVTKILDRIAQQQAGYYVLTYRAEGFSFDFLTNGPTVSRVAVKTKRDDAVVRARNGVFGSTDSSAEQPYSNPEREFDRALGEELVNGGVHTKLTGFVMIGNSFSVEGLIHVDVRDLTFRKDLDRRYRASVDTALALYGEDGVPSKEVARTVDVVLSDESFPKFQTHGVDYTISLALPKPGSYQLRSITRDGASGRIGSARQFLHAANWNQGNLVMSSIVLRGEFEKGTDGAELTKDPDESAALRIFKAGRQIPYTYSLFNVAADAQKRSSIEVRAQVFRDGVLILDGDPAPVAFGPVDNPGRRTATGLVRLNDRTLPGQYIFRLIVADKLGRRTATQQTDFEVRP